MKLAKKFGKRLKEIRKRNGLTQEQLAELLGMDTTNITKLEAGEHLPKKDNLEKLCVALNVEVKELFEFGHIKTKSEIIEELNNIFSTFSLKDLQYFKKIADAYLETK
ncbi:helix-turn-helix transcriptional regulator [bacterium]|nr:helix-turn-helix transcriptional regulator [bacterium]